MALPTSRSPWDEPPTGYAVPLWTWRGRPLSYYRAAVVIFALSFFLIVFGLVLLVSLLPA